MKTLLAFILSSFVLSSLAMAGPYYLYQAADQSFRGPFTDQVQPTVAGETVVTITDAQYAALNVVRTANPSALHFAFDGTNFTVAKIDQLRLALLADFSVLTPGEQLLFAPQLQAVTTLLNAGNVPQARLVVFLSGAGMPTDIATARTNMLADFDRLFPPQ